MESKEDLFMKSIHWMKSETGTFDYNGLKSLLIDYNKFTSEASHPGQSVKDVKTLDQIKDEIAREYGHRNWANVKNKSRRGLLDVSDLIDFFDEANDRFYASKVKPVSEWVSAVKIIEEANEVLMNLRIKTDNKKEPITEKQLYDVQIMLYKSLDLINLKPSPQQSHNPLIDRK